MPSPTLVTSTPSPFEGAALLGMSPRAAAWIRVFVISDFQLLLEALVREIRERSQRYQLLGRSDSVRLSPAPWGDAWPDVVLLDLDMGPDRVLPWLAHWCHEAALKVLLLSRAEDPSLHDRAILAGARGLIGRQATFEQLMLALDKIHDGEVWLDHASTSRLLSGMAGGQFERERDPLARQLAQLTEREKKVLAGVLRHSGDSARGIAARLFISESTLRNHLTSIYDKLGVANRTGLIAQALQSGLAERLLRPWPAPGDATGERQGSRGNGAPGVSGSTDVPGKGRLQ